jgi:hypothetical protein
MSYPKEQSEIHHQYQLHYNMNILLGVHITRHWDAKLYAVCHFRIQSESTTENVSAAVIM